MTTVLLAQDPGLTTGLAWLDLETGEHRTAQLSVEEYYDFVAWFYSDRAARGDRVLAVTEDFVINMQTAKKTPQPWSLMLRGVMAFVAHLYGQPAPVLQNSQAGKTYGTDDKLRYAGWYVPGKRHANDASRHMLKFAVDRGLHFTKEDHMKIANLGL